MKVSATCVQNVYSSLVVLLFSNVGIIKLGQNIELGPLFSTYKFLISGDYKYGIEFIIVGPYHDICDIYFVKSIVYHLGFILRWFKIYE